MDEKRIEIPGSRKVNQRLKRLGWVGDSGSPWSSSLKSGMIWGIVGALSQQGSMLVASILIARWVGKTKFGEFILLQGTLTTFATVIGMGLSMTATRYVAACREEGRRVGEICRLLTSSSCVLGIALTMAVIAFAGPLARDLFKSEALEAPLRWGGLYVGVSLYNSLQSGILTGLEAFQRVAQLNAVRGAVVLSLSGLLVPQYGVTGGVLALVLSALAATVYGQVACGRELDRAGVLLPARTDWRQAPLLWRFLLPAMLSNSVVTPALWLANVLLVRQANGYGELALLGMANQWRNVAAFLPSVLSQPLLPLLSAARGRGSKSEFSRLLITGGWISAGSATLAGMVVVVLAPQITAIYGREFGTAVSLLTVLMGGTVINAVGVAIGYALIAFGDIWHGLLLNAIWGVTFLLLSAVWVEELGARGIANAFLVSYIVHAGTTYLYVRYRLFKGWEEEVIEQPTYIEDEEAGVRQGTEGGV